MAGTWVATVAAATVVTVTAGAGALLATRAGEALPGTTVAGVDVQGLDRREVLARVGPLALSRTTGPLLVTAGDRRIPVDRAALVDPVGLEGLADRAVRAGRSGYPLASVVGPLLPGQEHAVGLPVEVDEQAVRTRVDALAAGLRRAVEPGGIAVEGTTVTVRAPVAGRELDRAAARAQLTEALRTGRAEPLPLPLQETAPASTLQEVEQVAAQARAALAGPYRLSAGSAVLELAPRQVGEALRAVRRDGRLVLDVDRAVLGRTVAGLASAVDRAPRDARFEVAGRPPRFDDKGSTSWTPRPAQVRVVPGRTGVDVDVEAAVARVAELVASGGRTGALPARTVAPERTTAALSGAGVTGLVSTFTTYYTAGQPRATNIARIAEIVDGTYLAPGETFSLNGTAGRRTRAKGFVADGAIIDGELEDVVGGGVSQFATTTFNAAFFAGLPIPDHQPHSFFISRYPAGRESTVNFPTIDVVFRNDTAHGLLVKASTTASSVTVALYGDNGGRRVVADHQPRAPRDGGGFRTTVVRTVSGGDGKGGRRVFTWSYGPPPAGH